ncbi:Sporulation related domain-containing protein [Candidatus Thermokryptus mobilis]|uniref:Sporulation related domain-containing protein n=1 Tax=Candidatus Thermokryptus mobilis TaxID=1643428 RepID=A0A0S4MUJ4_9BACT|nr:SPOR domain-containing protein [Candidatus Thermokryptus mobilis]CUU02668.1 Sporulation related domain-containing protein [Candidatus Thermokryptus mobilis]
MKKVLALLILVAPLYSQNKDSLYYYEKQFNPQIYDIKELVLPKKFLTDETGELTSGYRVQIFVTDQLDSANSVKNYIQSILSSAGIQAQVYIVYEPPNYKVRVGDFEHLQEASSLRNFFIERGFKYAWIVPDKIKKR